MSEEKRKREVRAPNLFWALAPILVMVGLMIYVFGIVANSDEYDAAHMPLICSIVVACCVGVAYGRSFPDMLKGITPPPIHTSKAWLLSRCA